MAFEANAGSTEKNECERSRLRGRQWRGFEYRVIDDKKKLTFNTTYTTGIAFFTLGKGFADCNTRQRTLGKDFIGKGFFAECFFSDTRQRLCRVSKSTRQRKTLGKLRIEIFLKKTAKHFLNSRNNSPTLSYYLTRCPIIFHYYFELNLYVL
jgi:hypothetical protein